MAHEAGTLPCGIVIGEGPYSTRVTELLRQDMEPKCKIEQYPDTAALLNDCATRLNSDNETEQIPFVVAMIGEDTPSADEVLRPVVDMYPFRNTRFMVMCTSLEITGVDWLTDQGRLDWVGYAPGLQTEAFLDEVQAQLVRFREHQKPDSTFRVSSLFDQPFSDSVIVKKVLDRIEMSLGPQPRIKLPAGVRLTSKGQWLEEVTIILKGRVALIHRLPDGEAVVMHEESTGRIIGLLAASEGRRALLNAITTTEVIGVRLTVEQMNSAIHGHPDITLLLATLFIRSLDRRLRRAEALHIQNVELSEQLATERAQLATALKNLEEARVELSAQERLASLGALAAGIAHELNNPMAAIQRISQYLGEDVTALLKHAPDKRWSEPALAALESGMTSPSLPSKAERALRRELTEATGDPAVAQRLVLAGVRDVKLASKLKKRGAISVDELVQAASIGTQLRNLSSASKRITELVSSLRSYARPDGDAVTDVDVHQNLDDAIRLLSHKFDGIEVDRKYKELPTIEGYPGQLAQVWTNILTNAAEAITDAAEESGAAPSANSRIGKIRVKTSNPRPGWVRIEIQDDGPGIPDSILPQVYEPRFTTKSGQVRFGMGIGLGVSRTIIGRHHGTMRISTSPEGTNVVVDLPVEAPEEEQ